MVSKGQQFEDLLARLRKGDEAAFSLLFYHFKDKLFGFLLDLTKSEAIAEDMVQNVFLRIWQDRDTISEVNNLNAYIFRVAKNMAIDYIRKYARETYPLASFLENESLVSELDPHTEFVNRELYDKIKEAVNNLPPQQQKVYILHSEQGLKYDEIAELLNLSTSTIRNHLMHALSSLRGALSHMLFDLFFVVLVFFKTFFK